MKFSNPFAKPKRAEQSATPRRWSSIDDMNIDELRAFDLGRETAVASEIALAKMRDRKDAAYFERNQCVALIARMAIALGYTAGVAKTAIPGWSEDWHGCVYIDLPTGQVSWHFHDSQSHLYTDLPPYTRAWDGHDTPEKYLRVGDALRRSES